MNFERLVLGCINAKIVDEMLLKFAIGEVQRYVNLIDLVKSFPTNIYLQKSASIQPRTSLSKFI